MNILDAGYNVSKYIITLSDGEGGAGNDKAKKNNARGIFEFLRNDHLVAESAVVSAGRLLKLGGAEKVEAAAGIEREVRQTCRVDDDVVGIPEWDRGEIGGENLLDL
jgi:hypothetical protein